MKLNLLYEYLKIIYICKFLGIFATNVNMECESENLEHIIPNLYNTIIEKFDLVTNLFEKYEYFLKDYWSIIKNNKNDDHEYFHLKSCLTEKYKNKYDNYLKSVLSEIKSNNDFYLRNKFFFDVISNYHIEIENDPPKELFFDILSIDQALDLVRKFELFDFHIFEFENDIGYHDPSVCILEIHELIKNISKYFKLLVKTPNLKPSKYDFDIFFMYIKNFKIITNFIYSKINPARYEISKNSEIFTSFLVLVIFIQKVEFYYKVLCFKYFKENFNLKKYLNPLLKSQIILLFKYEFLLSDNFDLLLINE